MDLREALMNRRRLDGTDWLYDNEGLSSPQAQSPSAPQQAPMPKQNREQPTDVLRQLNEAIRQENAGYQLPAQQYEQEGGRGSIQSIIETILADGAMKRLPFTE